MSTAEAIEFSDDDKPSFRLRRMIRDTVANHPNDDPGKVAAIVNDLVEDDDLRDLFAVTLYPYVVNVIGEDRRRAMDSVLAEPVVPPATQAGSNYSVKLAERRAYQDSMRQLFRCKVNLGANEWKLIGDCTVDDLTIAIEQRQQLIDRTEKQIANLRHVITLMRRKKAVVASDILKGDK